MPTATPVESLVAVLAMALIAVLCRWVFSPVHPPVRRSAAAPDYGLLTPVTVAPTAADAEMLRDLLVSQGIRASVGADHEVLVFPPDEARARSLVGSRST